jgi:pyruvoyl-dependent arginine decarboxylase (PvlArgDC)
LVRKSEAIIARDEAKEMPHGFVVFIIVSLASTAEENRLKEKG